MASSYKTRSGDTWDAIAYRVLGDERYMPNLLDANPDQHWVARFDAGVELVIPDIPAAPLPSSLPPWRRA